MIQLLNSLGAPGIAAIFLVLIMSTVLVFRYITNQSGRMILAGKHEVLTKEKKYADVDVFQYRGLIRNISLVLALGITVAVFEFPIMNDNSLVDLGTLDAIHEEFQEIPPTEQKPPPPPKIVQPEIIAVSDEIEIEQKIDVILDVEVNQEMVVEEVVKPVIVEEKEVEVIEEVFHIVEETAAPIGGYEAFYNYIKETLKYPRQAAEMRVEGKVYIQFIVDKDGSITEVKAIRGIGAGCDEEAVRVVKGAPKWKPGKQRGRAVKQYMVLPISFILA